MSLSSLSLCVCAGEFQTTGSASPITQTPFQHLNLPVCVSFYFLYVFLPPSGCDSSTALIISKLLTSAFRLALFLLTSSIIETVVLHKTLNHRAVIQGGPRRTFVHLASSRKDCRFRRNMVPSPSRKGLPRLTEYGYSRQNRGMTKYMRLWQGHSNVNKKET